MSGRKQMYRITRREKKSIESREDEKGNSLHGHFNVQTPPYPIQAGVRLKYLDSGIEIILVINTEVPSFLSENFQRCTLCYQKGKYN